VPLIVRINIEEDFRQTQIEILIFDFCYPPIIREILALIISLFS